MRARKENRARVERVREKERKRVRKKSVETADETFGSRLAGTWYALDYFSFSVRTGRGKGTGEELCMYVCVCV